MVTNDLELQEGKNHNLNNNNRKNTKIRGKRTFLTSFQSFVHYHQLSSSSLFKSFTDLTFDILPFFLTIISLSSQTNGFPLLDNHNINYYCQKNNIRIRNFMKMWCEHHIHIWHVINKYFCHPVYLSVKQTITNFQIPACILNVNVVLLFFVCHQLFVSIGQWKIYS